MFTNFHIERFRGIPKLDIDGVKPITLLVGKNNTGKTSVLEAIFLLCGAGDPFTPTVIGQLRGQRITTVGEADTVWRSLFQGMNSKECIKIVGRWDNKEERRLKLEAIEEATYSDDSERPLSGVAEAGGRRRIRILRLSYTTPVVPSRVGGQGEIITHAEFDPQTHEVLTEEMSEDASPGGYAVRATFLSSRAIANHIRDTEHYSALVRSRREEEVIAALRLIDPRIRGLAVVSESRGATMDADLGGESLIPLAVCGEGMLRLFSIVLAITRAKGGVLLIDEIDNGLHHSVMKELWPVLRKLCAEHNVQLIATTHNEEMLKYAIEAFRDDFNQFGLIRLDRITSGLRAVAYNAEALEGVAQTGWEVRG